MSGAGRHWQNLHTCHPAPPKFLDLVTLALLTHPTPTTSHSRNAVATKMFCSRCIRTSVIRRQIPLARQFSVAPFLRSAEPANLSTPETAPGEPAVEQSKSRSMCPEGTVLNGLNYTKGRNDPVALKDEEYPEWLWSCLDVMKKASDGAEEDAGDEFCTFYTPVSSLS